MISTVNHIMTCLHTCDKTPTQVEQEQSISASKNYNNPKAIFLNDLMNFSQ